MRVSGNQNYIQQTCTLYNKGIGAGDAASYSLNEYRNKAITFLKINEKKMVNYLAVPNNLLLSLSLSHSTWR